MYTDIPGHHLPLRRKSRSCRLASMSVLRRPPSVIDITHDLVCFDCILEAWVLVATVLAVMAMFRSHECFNRIRGFATCPNKTSNIEDACSQWKGSRSPPPEAHITLRYRRIRRCVRTKVGFRVLNIRLHDTFSTQRNGTYIHITRHPLLATSKAVYGYSSASI